MNRSLIPTPGCLLLILALGVILLLLGVIK